MAAFTLNDPPIDALENYPKFSIREIFQKVGFFEENTLGGRPKMKELLKNLESTWSGFFFNQKSVKLQ